LNLGIAVMFMHQEWACEVPLIQAMGSAETALDGLMTPTVPRAVGRFLNSAPPFAANAIVRTVVGRSEMLYALHLGMRRSQRGLAGALVGEIAGILRAIEDHPALQSPDESKSEYEWPANAVPVLPKFIIYEANARNICAFERGLAREIAYFYTCAGALSERLRSMSETAQLATNERVYCVHVALSDAKCALDFGGELLHHLRPFVSVSRPKSISRA